MDLTFPGKASALKCLSDLERCGCVVSEQPGDRLSIQLPNGVGYSAPGFATLSGAAWHIIRDAASAMGVWLSLPLKTPGFEERDLAQFLDALFLHH